MPTLICDCNKTMPLQEKILGAALGEELTLHSSLCRREAGAFQRAIQGGAEVVVACTQEKRLFGEIGTQYRRGGIAGQVRQHPRDRRLGPGRGPGDAQDRRAAGGGAPARSRAGAHRHLQERRAPADHRPAGAGGAGGGPGRATCSTSPCSRRAAPARRSAATRCSAARIDSLNGWLGAFELKWSADNPIDLDLCTRCNACVAACPEGAIGLDYQIDLAKCASHRACVKVCDVAGAIDFSRDSQRVQRAVRPGAGPARAARRFSSMRRRRVTSICRFRRRKRAWASRAWPRCSSCATWSASSKSRSSSPTSRSSAPTAATKRSAATPASTSARPRRSPATRAASRSRSTRTCASAAAPAPRCAPAAR